MGRQAFLDIINDEQGIHAQKGNKLMKILRGTKSTVPTGQTGEQRQGPEVSTKLPFDYAFTKDAVAVVHREKKKVYETPRCFQRN
jgi:hypothetical protein